MAKQIKPETEIRNLKRDLKELRSMCVELGIPPMIVYLPSLMFHKKKNFKMQPRLSKRQKLWLDEKKKEFDKMRKK